MEIIFACKLQIAILIILFYVGYLFIRDGDRIKAKTKSDTVNCNKFFDLLFVIGDIAVIFDGISAYTVNNLEVVPLYFNNVIHLIFFLAYQAFGFVHFLYWLSVLDCKPRKLIIKIAYYLPIIVSFLITIIYSPKIVYFIGNNTNYAMGVSATTCFIIIGFYSILTVIHFFIRRTRIRQNKRTGFAMALTAVCAIILLQVIFNELLITSIAIALIMVSIYLCMENPTIKYLEFYHEEMVMGFATLVEGKDGNTGGHIHRSSAYAILLAKALRGNPKYKQLITKDYIDDLNKAAPMHDIGKISIPDSILQKPGKLTDEEFDIMKTHPEIGAKLIKNTFGHLDNDKYESMAYSIALSHHEKWNGKGYPRHLKEEEIPLCARIMAVADVFDAISAKRCYRDAMPLEVCYQIMRDGRGQDFDPEIIDVFFNEQEAIEQIYHNVGLDETKQNGH